MIKANQYGIKKLVFNNNDQFKTYTGIATIGSTAYIIETQKTYILDSNNTWRIMPLNATAEMNNNSQSFTTEDEGKVVQNGTLIEQTNGTVLSNQIMDTTTIKELIIDVPNTYTIEDEGKVVYNSTLIDQTQQTVNTNGIVDTTTINEITIEVPEAVLINKTVTANGTYLPSADSADGYKKVVVNVPTPTPILTPKTITENGIYIPQDDGADGYDTVTVDVQGDDYFPYARSLDGMFNIPYSETYRFPFEEISINAPLVSSVSKFWSTGAFSAASQKARGVKKISLNIKNIFVAANAPAFNGTPDLEEITIQADNAYGYGEARSFLSYLPGLKKISGVTFNGNVANWTYATSNAVIYFPTGSALEEIRFVPDSMKYAGTYQLGQHGNLSNDSLVSIANAMSVENTVKEIRLHASAAARLSSIMGTVADGAFGLDPAGQVTLLDFITNTKGWTVV